MPLATYTINDVHPARRFSYPFVVTLSNVVADKNLQINGIGYKYIQNVGTGGLVNVRWGNGTDVNVYLNQGEVMEGGLWVHAYNAAGGTAAGVDLRGFVGMAGLGI